jgi:hypothetical protein
MSTLSEICKSKTVTVSYPGWTTWAFITLRQILLKLFSKTQESVCLSGSQASLISRLGLCLSTHILIVLWVLPCLAHQALLVVILLPSERLSFVFHD